MGGPLLIIEGESRRLARCYHYGYSDAARARRIGFIDFSLMGIRVTDGAFEGSHKEDYHCRALESEIELNVPQ